ncbi:UNVERIFIED_CONTAM: hypothetical protein FKN15_012179 [Acipenser sinensis]
MGRRRKQQQQVQQHGAGHKSRRVSAVLDICLTCLRGEEWCFAVGEVGHVAPDQPPPWQVREEPECPAPMWEEDEGSVRPQPKRGEAERPQPKAPLAGEEYLLVSPPPPPSEGKEQELPLHSPRRTGPLSSEGIWDWLAEPERDIVDALPVVINLLWARDGERWEAWEQKHHPASLPDITAMVLNYLAADMRGAPLLFTAPEGEEPVLPSPAPEGGESSLPSPVPEGEESSLPSPAPEGEEPLLPSPTPEGEEVLLPSPALEGEEPSPLSPALGAEQQELPLSPPPPGAEQQELLLSPPPPGAEQQELPLPPPPPPAEGEYLLVPSQAPWEDCLQLPTPPAESECLLVPPQPPWEDCLPLPPPPTEGEYLLVPPQSPWEDCLPLPPPPAEDGCHIRTEKSQYVDAPETYYNRKQYYSINLTSFCNKKSRFIHKLFGMTEVARALQEDPQSVLPHNLHITGDAAYPLSQYLMTPFRDNGHLSQQQKRYNQKLSSARMVIERAFGLLKNRCYTCVKCTA